MKKILFASLATFALITGCSKSDDDSTVADFNTTKNTAITDFVNKIALPAYLELKTKAAVLNTAIINLNITTTEDNLTVAKNSWRDMRSTWERCEGFLFGPVDADEYDPETDTWPVNFTDMDALLASAQPLTPAAIEALTSRSLKGYHPIEYILWGQGGTRTAASLTARQKEYVVSLSIHLKSQADQLYNSWIASGGNYANKFLTAGTGSADFVKKQDAFLAITDGLVGICGEVGDGKMKDPFDNMDPQIVESPFSGNSITDFKNNIIGAFNVYKGNFNEDGAGLQDLVKLRNSALNVQIEQKFNTAINSFSAITSSFEQAIISQRTQCQATMTALNDLSALLDTDLRAFVITNITD